MSEKRTTYHEQSKIDNTLKLREVLKTLPRFSREYFRAIDLTTSIRTQLSYAYDLRVFFNYLKEVNPLLSDTDITALDISFLDKLKADDIIEYMEYLKVYNAPDGALYTNGEKGVKRKMSSLRSFYTFYCKHGKIETNPTLNVDMPKLHDKAIVRLDSDEVSSLLDIMETCEQRLEGQALRYYQKTKERDIAIMTLLLGTGIRVSECVGLDIEDLDFKNNGMKLTRKGGNEMIVYFGDEVSEALKRYIEVRKNIEAVPGDEHALFYSTQRKRMGIQAVENMVKKYAKMVTTAKKITPHKLRSTYGSALYRETGDIYLVADVLGHSDVNTTKKHYAAIDDSRRRRAASVVKLRED